MAAVLPSILSDLTNEERRTQNLSTLTVSPILNNAAQMKANDMATKGYFAHTSPEGITPWYWLVQAGYQYQYAGENLAINFSDSKDVTTAWMNSPTHRANIVKENYTEVGTGIATGIYKGKETVFVAQVYANPRIEQENEFTTQIKTAIKKTTTPIKSKPKEVKNVLGAEVETKPAEPEVISSVVPEVKPTLLQKTVASPRNSSNIILFIISGIVILSLILNILIKIKHHHPDLITNGLITLAIIGAILATNYYLTHRDMTIIQSLDYSIENIDIKK